MNYYNIVSDGPIITDIPGKNVRAGTELSVTPKIDANPNSSLVWWTRKNDLNFSQIGPTLSVPNMQKENTDNYTCHVQNTLMPSGHLMQNMTAEKMFYVNVQCEQLVIRILQVFDKLQ